MKKIEIEMKINGLSSIYNCKICGKSYLSYPALFTHNKNKHKDVLIKSDRGRGRPKKENQEVAVNEIPSPYNLEYFNYPLRQGEMTKEECTLAIKEIFIELDIDIFKAKYENPEEYPLYVLINNPKLFEKEIEDFSIDEVFVKYLLTISQLTNKEFFKRIGKYVLLYREYINLMKNDSKYTSTNNAEDVPDICNDFIVNYIYKNDSKYGFSKNEIADFTINLCNWMFDSDFTCSKLSPI